MRGIEHGETIARSPNQPLTLSEALEVYANLSREFVAGPREVSLTALDSLQDFFALMLQYPVIPRLAADTKECPECYFETVGRDQKDALVLPLRHESFALVEGSSAGVVDPSEERNLGALADGGEEMARADPCGDMFPTTKRLEDLGDRGPARAAKFLEQLEWLKRRDEIVKQNALGKEISHQLGSYSHPLEELEAPRYLSSYPLRWLYRIYGSLNRSRDRARILATSYSEERADASRARLAVEELKASLGSMASTGNQRQAALVRVHSRAGPRAQIHGQVQRYGRTGRAIQAPGGLWALGRDGIVHPEERAAGQTRFHDRLAFDRGSRATAEKDYAAHGLQ